MSEPGINMKYLLMVTTGLLFISFLSSCDRSDATGKRTTFNTVTAKLSTIPDGYEAGESVFSPDGYHVATILKNNGKAVMSFDGIISQFYDEVKDPLFNPGSSSFAFVAKKGDKECVVVDRKEGSKYDSVTRPLFLADGRLAYTARNGSSWVVVVGETVSQPFYAAASPYLFRSPDGKRIAHEEQDKATKKVWLTVRGIDFKNVAKGQEYDSLTVLSGNFSPDHLVYTVGQNSRKSVVTFTFNEPGCSEKVSGWYDNIGRFALSSDGKHLAYLAEKNQHIVLVIDGNESPVPKLDMILDMTSSKNGTIVFSGVQKDKVVTFINGKDSGKYFETVDYLSFSRDGVHFAFVAGAADTSSLVIDAFDGPKYDKIVSPKFSPDGTQVVYRARKNNQRFVVVANLQAKTIKEHSHYDAVWDTVFSPDGKTVGYGVKIGQELWWKVETL